MISIYVIFFVNFVYAEKGDTMLKESIKKIESEKEEIREEGKKQLRLLIQKFPEQRQNLIKDLLKILDYNIENINKYSNETRLIAIQLLPIMKTKESKNILKFYAYPVYAHGFGEHFRKNMELRKKQELLIESARKALKEIEKIEKQEEYEQKQK